MIGTSTGTRLNLFRQYTVPIVRMDLPAPKFRIAHPFLRCKPKHRSYLWADIEPATGGAEFGNVGDRWNFLGQCSIHRLRLKKRCFRLASLLDHRTKD